MADPPRKPMTPGGGLILSAASVTREPTQPHDPSDVGGRTTSPLPLPQPGTQPLPQGRDPITPNTRPANSPYPADQNRTRQ
jgi:hypothetical protein